MASSLSDIDWSLVASATFGVSLAGTMFYVYSNRAKPHDNIPMLPMEFNYIFGHTPDMVKSRHIFHEKMCKIMVQTNNPKLMASTRFWNIHSVFLNDPKLIEFVFEKQFESFLKGAALQERYFELLGKGIFMSDPPEWKLHRKAGSRMFSHRNLKDYMFEMSVKHSKNTINKLCDYLDIDSGININDILGRFTLDTFCEIAFGQNINSVAIYPKPHQFGIVFDEMVEQIGKRSNDIFWKVKRIINIGRERDIYNYHKIMQQFVDDIVKRQKVKTSHKLSDETGKASYDILSLFLKFNPNLTNNQLKDIAMNFIIAGRDTTRMLLSWFIHELTKQHNEGIKNKIYKEIDSFDGEPNYNDFVAGFKYLEAALCETLRLNPSVPFLARMAIKDVKIPLNICNNNGKEYILRKGDYVVVHTYSYGRNPNLWDNPLTFDPLRFIEKGLNQFDQLKYPFFNINPRMCLGKQFAMVEAKVFAYYFIKTFTFKMVNPKNKLKIKMGAILNMANGLYIKLNKRK